MSLRLRAGGLTILACSVPLFLPLGHWATVGTSSSLAAQEDLITDAHRQVFSAWRMKDPTMQRTSVPSVSGIPPKVSLHCIEFHVSQLLGPLFRRLEEQRKLLTWELTRRAARYRLYE